MPIIILISKIRRSYHGVLFSVITLTAFLAQTAMGQTVTVLHTFTKGTKGALEITSLFPGSKGVLYGTTAHGGKFNKGTVFEIAANGTETDLYDFTGKTDGSSPYALVEDLKGNFYGVVPKGGTYGKGAVFHLTPAGVESSLYSFTGKADGKTPAQMSSLALDSAGNLYGIALGGGKYKNGVIFQVTSAGTESVLFNVPKGQIQPFGPYGMVRSATGDFYGANSDGATGSDPSGSVFKVSGGVETVLYSFCPNGTGENCTDGSIPITGMVLDAKGNLFGTTFQGGSTGAGGAGVVFKLTSDGVESVSHSFFGPPTDGVGPWGPLAEDSAGNLYGVTYAGGNAGCNGAGCGTIFEVPSKGSESVLYNFTGGTDGVGPYQLVRDSSGNLYGAAGTPPNTVVFKLVP